MTGWREERLAQRPDEVEIISNGKLIQRRSIQEVRHQAADGQPEYTEFVCQSRILSAAEYATQVAADNAATQAYIDMMLEDM